MKKDEIKEYSHTNMLILFEFYNRMKGVIHNRYGKGKGFQFALLERNLNELCKLMSQNNQELERLFDKKCRCEKQARR